MALNKADVSFLRDMIPHHRAAVRMARAVLRDGEDPKVRTWARAIIETQEREIEQMGRALEQAGGGGGGGGGMRGM